MTRWLILGATGTVGRELASQLAQQPNATLFVLARNRVLLDELAQRLNCEPLVLDLTDRDTTPEALPQADVVVDLTYVPGGRHPRLIIQRAERTIRLLESYLRLHRGAQLIHTGTYSVMAGQSESSPQLRRTLVWTSNYLLAKSAAERALSRVWRADQMRIVRLGNVVTPDSMWGVALLRALRANAIANPRALDCAANLSTIGELAGHVTTPANEEVSLIRRVAGWSWGEVLAAITERLQGRDEPRSPGWQIGVDETSDPEERKDTMNLRLAPLVRRALWLAPASLDRFQLSRLPGYGNVLRPVRDRLLGRDDLSIHRLPPRLPAGERMPGARRDAEALDLLAADLAAAFVERGYSRQGW